MSSSDLTDWNVELKEVDEEMKSITPQGVVKTYPQYHSYNMNKEKSERYSLMWSLALVRQTRKSLSKPYWADWVKTENNWLPQMLNEFKNYD